MPVADNLSNTGDSSNTFVGVNDEAADIFIFVFCATLCQIVNLFGVVTNSINIVCFVNEGFKDPVNVSLLGLSISDLGGLVTMIFTCIFATCEPFDRYMPFDSFDLAYMISGTPHFIFNRVGSCITAMITLERCLSIAVPLKVKSIVTTKRTALSISCMFIIIIGSTTPIYIGSNLGNKFSQQRNTTILGIVRASNKAEVENTALFINFLISFGAFIIIVICTTVLSAQLKMKSEWRKTNVNGPQADTVSSRNQRVAKMVVLISSLYIVCFIPATVMMFAVIFEPALFLEGKYVNLLLVINGVGYTLESINSSVNIFIYHHMSSKYRDTFSKIFWKIKGKM